MHGRLKIKTTAQQEAEKLKERKIKLAGYRQVMAAIMSRRKEGIKDEKQLKMTGQVLMSNPDIHTLWNIRRECIHGIISEQNAASEKANSNPEQLDANNKSDNAVNDADIISGDAANDAGMKSRDAGNASSEKCDAAKEFNSDELWMKEVELTAQCLMANPKSYGAWHHRCYSLDQMKSPPWDRELLLCEKFLSADERNFHCWDYRQIAASRLEAVNGKAATAEKELEFTMEKINNNFSNYSAWHYRSKLLPKVYPRNDNVDEKYLHIVEESVHHSELELVQNAAFTDPDDSSAWFYHTWLLGNQGETCAKLLFLKTENGTLNIATTKAVAKDDLKISINDSQVDMSWEPGSKYRNCWTAPVADGVKIMVSLNSLDDEVLELVANADKKFELGNAFKNIRFNPKPNEATEKVLLEELDNCQQLLELEPDSKWPTFTLVMIMKTLDSQKYFNEILELFEKLAEIDFMRRNYYQDMKSKFIIENALETNKTDFQTLNLSGGKISKLFYPQYLKLFSEVKYELIK